MIVIATVIVAVHLIVIATVDVIVTVIDSGEISSFYEEIKRTYR